MRSALAFYLRRYIRSYRTITACARPSAMEDGKAEGEKKKKKPKRAESKDKIPPTKLDAGAKPAPVAEVPVRYEGCGPCKRAVPDVPLSDAGRTSRDLLFALFF